MEEVCCKQIIIKLLVVSLWTQLYLGLSVGLLIVIGTALVSRETLLLGPIMPPPVLLPHLTPLVPVLWELMTKAH